ncbi:MAG: amidophosphoribosyltransferase [Candidatus Omnitrophica bacterium]|nr:amidophosphoribosyltransferase [Candidatus Omnitrophota bacterium]MBU1784358.1 amidophosphoribosyltransferase [Candidatus Omnitrophota bacterium]MBU1851340.1 amidophosphoribosyltransferase [Candidatus Omnitrophota bacterium]
MDKKEYCGVFGVFNHASAVELTYLGLYSLQHRGEESCGMAVSDGKRIRQITGMGLVSEVLNAKKLSGIKGTNSIGHVRYSTTGSSILRNAQPFVINHNKFSISIAHNGNLTNAVKLRREMERDGAIFQTTMDSEVVLHLMVRSEEDGLSGRLLDALNQCDGAFTMIFLSQNKLIGVRDPYGFRPLCLGVKDGSYVLASETCSLDLIGAEYVRDVEPGEMVIISDEGITSRNLPEKENTASCIFEFIYFARPDSRIFGQSVYKVRERLGEKLAEEYPVEADMVMSIPDSGNYAALGYSKKSGIPFEFGMVRNHYIGRTFIQPSQEMRKHGVKIKLNPIREVLKGKKVVVVEDSIVRGTTTSGRIQAIREAGAREIHMRISCPPIKHACFYGIDFPSRKELIANQMDTIEDIGKFIGVDTLKYLSIGGMMDAVSGDKEGFCKACFNGQHPNKVNRRAAKSVFESS